MYAKFFRWPALAFAACFASAAQAACPTMDTVTTAWLPIMQTTAYYAALEDKLFEAQCITIVSNRMESPNQIIDALVSGRADFGPPGAAAGIAAMAEAKFPGTLKVFGLQGGGVKSGFINDGLIVKPDSAIKSFADLKGKSLGHLPGIQWRTISRRMVQAAGLDPDKDVRLVELAVPLQVQAVASGTVDAVLALEPVGSIAVASGAAKRVMVNPVSQVIADPFYSGAAVMTAKFLQERPDVARRVVAVIDEATQRVNADFGHYRAILPKYTPIRADQIATVAQPLLRGFAAIDDTDVQSYQKLLDVFIDAKLLPPGFTARSMLLQPAALKP
jgi:NitT/TauT family transport system substrate-binding protein